MSQELNFAYLDALNIIASQIKSFGLNYKDINLKDSSETVNEHKNIGNQGYCIGIDGCKGGWIWMHIQMLVPS